MILITGGSGYLGNELVQRLYMRNKIRVIARDEGKLGEWGINIAEQLPVRLTNVFGLDDFLPIDYIDTIQLTTAIELTTLNPEIKRTDF